MNITFIIFGLIISQFAFAGAKVTLAEGEVRWSKTDLFKPVQLNQTLDHDDTILTGANGIAILTFDDGSQLKLNPKSVLTIGDSNPKADTQNKTVVKLLRGGVLSKITPQQSGKFQVKTKSATMGVRGTSFYTGYGYNKNDYDTVRMTVNEGLVAVENPKDQKAAPVLVKPGEGIEATPQKQISAPGKMAWMKEVNWAMDKSPVLTSYRMPKKHKPVTTPEEIEKERKRYHQIRKMYGDDEDPDKDYKKSTRHKKKF